MKKKVLAIVSSPRINGNSEILVDEFLKGAIGTDKSIQKICLRDYNIGFCKACEHCVRNPGKCIQKDDMEWILRDMINADVIVLSTPMYYQNVSAQLKTLIDRCFAGGTLLKDKDFYFIVTASDENETMENTMKSLEGFPRFLPNAKIKGKIYGGESMAKGEIKNKEAMKIAYEYGKKC